jgi:hypothetical protein
MEFIRRFSLHILPKGFIRIRHYGILSSSAKHNCAIIIKDQLPEKRTLSDLDNCKIKSIIYNPKECPCCKKEMMETIMRFNRRGPPADWKEMAINLLACIATGSVTGVQKN